MLTRTIPLALVLALSACEPVGETPDASRYLDALPDERVLVAMPAPTARSVGETAESYQWTSQVTGDVNGLIGGVLDTIDAITDFPPTWTEDEQRFLWGPWSDDASDPNELALYVEYDEAAALYAWALVERPRGSTDDDWVALVAGEATEGVADGEGSGTLAIDFDAIAALNPQETGAGAFYAEYALADGTVSAEAAFDVFTDDSTSEERISAGYRYGHDAAGEGYMDLAYAADIHEDGSAEETVVLRTRWSPDGAGRGDMVVYDGDLSPLVYQASECWNDAFLVVYEQNNATMTSGGDEADCAYVEPEWSDDAPES